MARRYPLKPETIERKLNAVASREPPPVPTHLPTGRVDYSWGLDYPDGKFKPEDVPEMLKQLSPRQVTYAAARVRGASRASATDLASCNEDTSRKWEKCPWWDSLCDRERAKIFGDKRLVFMGLTPKAVAQIERELSGECGDELAHSAAMYVLDQFYGKPQQTQIVEAKADTGDVALGLVDLLLEAQRMNRELVTDQRKQLEVAKGDVVVAEVTT